MGRRPSLRRERRLDVGDGVATVGAVLVLLAGFTIWYQRKVSPYLEGIRLEDRYAVIFSKYDLSCALESHEAVRCEGYTRDDAARIAINVVLYSLHEDE